MQIEIIKSINDAKFGEIITMLEEFFREDEYNIQLSDLKTHVGMFLESSTTLLAIGSENDIAVGFVTVTLMPIIEWGRIAEIGDLYIRVPWRRRGLASHLIRFAEDWTVKHDCKHSYVTLTKSASSDNELVAFYEKNSYRDLGRSSMYKEIK